ncbi:MAG: 30S ribosomal protein S1 [Candidatus Liptonbacteria bacterium]|nr:30S ribosomal protein S1 [Candidatus Liptonbacteria bacterium]
MFSDTTTSGKVVSGPVQLLKNELANLEWPREGGVMEATFLKKTARTALFDLGRFGTGIVFGGEYLNARDTIRNLTAGDKVLAKVVAIDGEDGCIELSLSEAGRYRLWHQVQELMETGEITKVKVLSLNPGGYLVALGELKAFLPISQLSSEHAPSATEEESEKRAEQLRPLVGQELSVKVINVNPKKNKLIVSERDTVNVNLRELLSQYQPGQEVAGIVSGIADFGIFIRFADNPQVEGLVHISEIDHRIIDNPKETVQMNEAVRVKIIDIREGRVYLSMKALKSDPWQSVHERYQAGQEVTGKVYKFNPFGAVITLEGGMQGVIHISEFGGTEEMRKALLSGETYSFVIDAVKPEEKRIVLKVKK